MPFSESSEEFAERRNHPRLSLKAFGFNHVCAFVRSGRRHSANLVDVSPGGARLALMDDRPPIAENDVLTVDLALASVLEDLSAVPARVRWTGVGDFGVSFDRELGLGNPELQLLLAK
jgi:hypothetical protein